MVLTITEENLQDFKNGFLCPKCGGHTNTFKHMYAKRWCPNCGYVLIEEGNTEPYNYLDHLDKDTKSLEDELVVLRELLLHFYINHDGYLDWPYTESILPVQVYGHTTEAKLVEIYKRLKKE